jgi:hypothetical protein
VSAWDPGQVKMFAKQIAESDEGRAWWAFPEKIRNAIISHHVLMVMFSQVGRSTKERSVSIDDVRELRIEIERRLADHHRMEVR